MTHWPNGWPDAMKSGNELVAGKQDMRNAAWPKYPMNFEDRPPIPVWVRVVWADDGEEWCEGLADRWNWFYVRVRFLNEPRALQGLIWVKAEGNIRRR